MAARTPRRSFATPFVVTLAAAPACYVQTASAPQPPPQQPVEEGPPPAVNQPQGPSQPPPVVIANPPPPSTTPANTQPQPSPPRATNQTPTQTGVVTAAQPGPKVLSESRWTVFKAKGSGCMAAIKVDCQPHATCNPPPPFKYTCPENVSLDKPVTVVSHDGVKCFVEFEMPSCPEGIACNPPRPREVACPQR